MANVKALLLFSGGLDSILAAKLLEQQAADVTALCFTSAFFGAGKAEDAARRYGLKLKVCDIGDEVMALVKNPPHGYGKNMNPCIDCHALMARKAGEIARAEGYDLVASGEVLGQRPFSQNRLALRQVEKLAEVEILRPLTAKNLPATAAEEGRLVDRGRLKGFKGRQREEQFKLAKSLRVDIFPTPSGGCLLTDQAYSERLARMLEYWPDCRASDASLLSCGRVFWLNRENRQKILLVTGRNHEENQRLDRLATKGDIMVELKEENGPSTLVRGLAPDWPKTGQITLKAGQAQKLSQLGLSDSKSGPEIIETGAAITAFYSRRARGKEAALSVSYR